MLQQDILWEDNGILGLGREGEEAYGRRNFLELYSVFLSPPLFSVRHGRQELGHVDETTFLAKQQGPQVLLLGGRSWRVGHIDWQRRLAYVEPSDLPGRSRWSGSGVSHGFALCQGIKRVLADQDERGLWSRRAREGIATVRQEFPWLQEGRTAIVHEGQERREWWTFGGARANAMLANEIGQLTHSHIRYDSFTLFTEPQVSVDDLQAAIEQLQRQDVGSMQPEVDERAVEGLKFTDCLSTEMAVSMLKRRTSDYNGAARILDEVVATICLG